MSLTKKYTNKQIEKMKKTGKSRGILGASDLVCYKKLIQMHLPYDTKILDFGTGTKEPLTRRLHRYGWIYATPYDFGYDEEILKDTYQYTILSNVLNIQPEIYHVEEIIILLNSITTESIIWNYPYNPRTLNYSKKDMEEIVNLHTDKGIKV